MAVCSPPWAPIPWLSLGLLVADAAQGKHSDIVTLDPRIPARLSARPAAATRQGNP